MDIIKNYLETMFANMPDTDEVRRAKAELWSMMEDKYNELIAEGKQKNEAIGTVISEFGNLDELADSLGLKNSEAKEEPIGFDGTSEERDDEVSVGNRQIIGIAEASSYVSAVTASRFLLGIGVMFCIFAPAGPILGEGFSDLLRFETLSRLFSGIGVALLFVLAAIGVGIIVLSPARKKEWKYLNKKSCVLDSDAASFVMNGEEQSKVSKSLFLSLGIVLCVLSIVPVSFFGAMDIDNFFSEGVGPAMIFILSGAGVFFILLSSAKAAAYKKLVALDRV